MAGKRRIAAEGLGGAGRGTSIRVFSAGDRLERGGGPWLRQPAPADGRSSTPSRHSLVDQHDSLGRAARRDRACDKKPSSNVEAQGRVACGASPAVTC
jgi:hypothetical protein